MLWYVYMHVKYMYICTYTCAYVCICVYICIYVLLRVVWNWRSFTFQFRTLQVNTYIYRSTHVWKWKIKIKLGINLKYKKHGNKQQRCSYVSVPRNSQGYHPLAFDRLYDNKKIVLQQLYQNKSYSKNCNHNSMWMYNGMCTDIHNCSSWIHMIN